MEKMEKMEERNIKTVSELIRELKGDKISEGELKDIEETVIYEVKRENIDINVFNAENCDYYHIKRFCWRDGEFKDYNDKNDEIGEVMDEDKIREAIRKQFEGKTRCEAVDKLKGVRLDGLFLEVI